MNFPPFHYFVESATIGTVINMIFRMEIDGTPIIKPVAKGFGFFLPEVFGSYLLRLKEIRNRCAHNGRIFNRNYRTIKVLTPYRHYFSAADQHKGIHVWMTLLFMLEQLDRYDDFKTFENEGVIKLLQAFKNNSPGNAMLANLPNNYDMKQWVALGTFILKGMGKR